MGEIVRENTLTFFNLVFCSAGSAVDYCGQFPGYVFLAIAAVNSLIGIIQRFDPEPRWPKLNLLAQARSEGAARWKAGNGAFAQTGAGEDIVELAAGIRSPPMAR